MSLLILQRQKARNLLIGLAAISQLAMSNQPIAANAKKASAQQPLVSSASPPEASIIIGDTVIRQTLPNTLFGFNIRWNMLQQDLWDKNTKRLKPVVDKELLPFEGALFRYPGGLVANHFDWQRSTLPMVQRQLPIGYGKGINAPLLFGVDEYFATVKHFKGQPLYTLNLTGSSKKGQQHEKSIAEVADINRRLASHIKNTAPNSIRYYQLGNELDRSGYQWSHEKYIARSRATIDAILSVDPDAKFIAFLREFNWRYRGGKKGISRWQDFTKDVLTALPMVNDFSIHLYYDDYIRPGGVYFDIPNSLDRIDRVLIEATRIRNGKTPNVWITEHSKRAIISKANEQVEKFHTTNLSAAISTADFMIALASVPAVKGASIQALNGVARQIFDARIQHKDLRPRPVYYAPRILKKGAKGSVLSTKVDSPNKSQYLGGYDIRAAALQSDKQLTVWAVNRANSATNTVIENAQFANKTISYQHFYVAGTTGGNADSEQDFSIFLEAPTLTAAANARGQLEISLPPSSVSSIIFSLAN